MNNPTLYQELNAVQKQDAQNIMTKFSHEFEGPSREKTLLLDVGCGSGDVLIEIISPKITSHSKEVIGVDISDDMIEFATQNYGSDNIKFMKVDIESDFLLSNWKASHQKIIPLKEESFDFVTSFYCLHWIQNQRFVFDKKVIEELFTVSFRSF